MSDCRLPKPDCPTGKIAYDNRAQARRVAREVSARKGDRPSSEYRCTYCGKFHIGRVNQTVTSRMRWRKIQQLWGEGGHVG